MSKSELSPNSIRANVLLVEDDEGIANSVVEGLEFDSYSVHWVRTGEEAIHRTRSTMVDALLVDISLPGMNGVDLVRKLRQSAVNTPIVALTARTSIEERITGLNAGFDDYIGKPFAFAELLARLRALLRRPRDLYGERLTIAGLVLDPITQLVSRDGKAIPLSNHEFTLLETLMRKPNMLVSKECLVAAVWPGYDGCCENRLRVFIRSLRRKIDEGFPTALLHTKRDIGYSVRDSGLDDWG